MPQMQHSSSLAMFAIVEAVRRRCSLSPPQNARPADAMYMGEN